MPRVLYDRFGFDRFGYNKDGYDRMGYNREGFDRDGYDRNGFNRQGINKLTGFDRDGYDKDGYDKDGFDRTGFDKDGYDYSGYNSQGYDRTGFNRAGLDKDGYNRQGYDQKGYDRQGYDQKGFNKFGYDKEGFNTRGYDIEGYDRQGFNGAGFDREGYDRSGYNKEGYNREGFDRNGMDREGYGVDGFDLYGFDREGNDQSGFNFSGWNNEGKNILGFYRDGFNDEGISIEGYSRESFDKDGYHIYTGFNLEGFDRDGYNINGLDREGYDREGYNSITGFNRNGYNRDGYDGNGFDQNGYNRNGLNRKGYDQDGFDVYGYDKNGYDRDGYNKDGYDHDGYNFEGYNADGELKPSLRKNLNLSYDALEDKKEQQYLEKCRKAVRKVYGAQIRDEIMKEFQPETKYFYDRSGLLQTRQTQPDLELAQREINEKVDKVIRTPYFAHIDYKYGTDIYIGKQRVGGWIIDWADERVSLYYQWQMYIGNEEQKLELVRDIHISDGNYIGYTDLYNAHQGEIKYDSFGDQHLAQIIAANQKNKKIHDIIESIQQNQYQIISSDMNKSLLVLGCAGSGKTMILMHKIRYMKYNHKELQMKDVIVLSPTDILSRESHELSRLLQIEAAGQFTIASFYEATGKELLKKLKLPYDEFHVIDSGINPKFYYRSDYLDDLQTSLSSIQHPNSSQKDLLNEWQKQLDEQISSYIKQSALPTDEVGKLNILYHKALKETDQAGIDNIKQIILALEKRVADRLKYENAQLVVHILVRGHILRDVPQLAQRKDDHLEQKFFYTLNVSGSIMGDIFLRGMLHQEFVPQNTAQCLQMIQLFLPENLDRDASRKLLNEWEKLSHQEAEAFEKGLSRQIEHLDHLEEKKELLEELLQKKMIRRKNAIRSNLDYETAFENLTQLYSRSREALEPVGLEPFSFFATYNKMCSEKERLQKQKKTPNQKVYLLDAIFRLLDIEVSYDQPTEISLPKAFLMISLLIPYTGALSSDKKYIFVDEFQDLSAKELRLIVTAP